MESFVQLKVLSERREELVIRLEQLPELINSAREEDKPAFERQQERAKEELSNVEDALKDLGWTAPENQREEADDTKTKKQRKPKS